MARVLNSVLLLTVIFAIGCDGDSKSAVKPGSPGPNAEDLLNSVATTTSDEKHGDEAVPRIASIGLLIGQGKTEEAKTQLKQVIEASVKENGSVNALQKLHALETMAQIAESEGRFEAALEYWALAIEHVDHSKIEGNKSPHFFHEFCQQQLKFDKSKREALIIAHQSLLQGQFNRSIEDLRQAADHYKRTLSSSHLLTKIATIQCERVLPSAEWLANNEFETARKEHEQFLGARAIYTLDAKLLRLDPIALEEIGDWFEGPNEVFESYLCIDQTRLFSSSLHESLHWMLKRKVDKTKAAQTKSEQLLPYVSRFPELQINYFNQVARFRFYSKAHQDLVDEMLKKSESVWKNNPELEKQQPNEVLVMLQGLAKSAMKQKRFTEAIQYADEVIRVAKANVPIRLQSMRIAEGLLMKGQIYSSTGKYELMEVNLRSALKRFSEFRKDHPMTGHARRQLAIGRCRAQKYDDAITLIDESIDLLPMAKRPESLALKTFAYIKLGKYGLARGLARESHELSVRLLLDDLETATVSEAINTIGDSVQFRRQMVAAALAENTPEAIDDAFCLVLEGKDLTYSFLVDREGVKVASGTSRLTSLEQNLTENTCVIDFVEYTADTADIASENELPRFAVFVVRKKREKLDVNCIDLGAVSEINDLVDARWGTIKRALDDDAKSKALDRLLANARGVNDNTKEKAVVQDEFDSIVWSKIQPFLDGVDQLIVCPKNRLAEFPWSSIRTDDGDRFIAESGISIVVNESASVYANRTELETKAGGWLAIGGVDYGSLEKRDTSNADENVTHTAYKLEPRFGPLPQSLEEARAVVEHSPQKESSKVLAGLEANKHLFLKYSKDFQNIHIATHGVKLSSFKDSAPENFYKVKPLSEWALVLSSANELKDGKLQEKNVLTAEEISQLDLEHVDLVILSSCYSANGRTTTDGLFGIEKALRIAGVKTTLTCLTRLDDRTARLFVESFCEHISQGESKSAAFHSAQLEMIKQKVPYQNWCCWVLSGDCG